MASTIIRFQSKRSRTKEFFMRYLVSCTKKKHSFHCNYHRDVYPIHCSNKSVKNNSKKKNPVEVGQRISVKFSISFCLCCKHTYVKWEVYPNTTPEWNMAQDTNGESTWDQRPKTVQTCQQSPFGWHRKQQGMVLAPSQRKGTT